MPELRTDPLTGRQVLFAGNRAGRPNEFVASQVPQGSDGSPQSDCPFCPGNESQNPTPNLIQQDNGGEWQIRVVPNKYPSVTAVGSATNDEYQGGHEVLIETRRHINRTSQLSLRELADVLRVYAMRLADWREEGRFPYRLLFKNVGPAAGASLNHLHSQVITLPDVPPLFAAELQNLEAQGGTPWQDWLDALRADGGLILAEQDGIVACCPPVSRQTYETWLMPKVAQPYYEDLLSTPEKFSTLAALLHPVTQFIENQLGADYNMMIYTAPLITGADSYFHWRIEIVPRTGSIAGFELPTNMFVNTLAPDHAAQQLRSAINQQVATSVTN